MNPILTLMCNLYRDEAHTEGLMNGEMPIRSHEDDAMYDGYGDSTGEGFGMGIDPAGYYRLFTRAWADTCGEPTGEGMG